jgi:hypothetical protein
MNPKFLVEVVPTIPSDLVSVKEGARIAKKTERTVWRDIRSGKLRAWGHTPLLSGLGLGAIGACAGPG